MKNKLLILSILSILNTYLFCTEIENLSKEDFIKVFSEKTHDYMKECVEVYKIPNIPDVLSFPIVLERDGSVEYRKIKKPAPEDLYIAIGKILPDKYSRQIVYECALISQEMRLRGESFEEGQTHFRTICPCDFYKNLTDKQLEDLKQGILQQ